MTTADERAIPERRYARAPDVLWRLAADRVVVRRVRDASPDAPAEIAGSAAVLWLALAVPRSAAELRAELEAAGWTDPAAEVDTAMCLLLGHRLIAVTEC